MTLKELYSDIDASYEQALRVLRIDRLLDKHIRKFATSDVIDSLIDARATMDAKQLFESAHAAKGICGNLGLTTLASLASQIAEEFRPSSSRTMGDDEVSRIIDQISDLYARTVEGIRRYEQS